MREIACFLLPRIHNQRINLNNEDSIKPFSSSELQFRRICTALSILRSLHFSYFASPRFPNLINLHVPDSRIRVSQILIMALSGLGMLQLATFSGFVCRFCRTSSSEYAPKRSSGKQSFRKPVPALANLGNNGSVAPAALLCCTLLDSVYSLKGHGSMQATRRCKLCRRA